uniref:Secreted protein n=1 Tax=Anopheles funestus TaxID=62324 RepID=A0A182S4H0_ANOFN
MSVCAHALSLLSCTVVNRAYGCVPALLVKHDSEVSLRRGFSTTYISFKTYVNHHCSDSMRLSLIYQVYK